MRMMRDGNGVDVPVKYVSAYDKARDAATRRILERFLRQRKSLETLVETTVAELEALKSSKATVGEKGNFQTSSFDGNVKVEICQKYNIRLDERVARAREIMLDYASHLAGQIEGNDGKALMQIVGAAFEANKSGILPCAKVLALLRLNIVAPEWLEAKSLLEASIKPERGKAYLACSVRPDRQHDFVPIRLDIADCWPAEKEVHDVSK
jgi:hypothetical protein